MSTQAKLTTPVVFIIFNRPQPTQRVFAEIRRARPSTLLVIADGPRPDKPTDEELCRQTRAVVDRVDWPCDVQTQFSEVNLGCGQRIASGLNWVFSNVAEAIILEDDCIPAPSFFGFCRSLLDYYRDDTRVVHIGSNNFQNGTQRTPYSYFFSKYNHIWGWATWRRAWQLFDHELSTWPEIKAGGWLRFVCDDDCERAYWTGMFDYMRNDKPNVWGYAWTYACFLHGLSVYPSVNLVSNIGYGDDATHCRRVSFQSAVPTADIWDISHPPCVVCHREADRYTFDRVFGGARQRQSAAARRNGRSLLARGKRKVVSWFKAR